MKKIINLQTGEVTSVELTAEEIAARDAYNQDVLPAELKKEVELKRSAAYIAEADPIFFKAQRGETTTDEWTAKVAEIKARFPYSDGGEE